MDGADGCGGRQPYATSHPLEGNSRDANIAVTATFDCASLGFNGDNGGAEIGTTKNGTIEIIRY